MLTAAVISRVYWCILSESVTVYFLQLPRAGIIGRVYVDYHILLLCTIFTTSRNTYYWFICTIMIALFTLRVVVQLELTIM